MQSESKKRKKKKDMPDNEETSEFNSNERSLKLEVPGAPRKPIQSIDGRMFWIYGEPKIGKTTFASKFPGAWFIDTEIGQDFVFIREPTYVSSWSDFLKLGAYIQSNQPREFTDGQPIRTIVIDTVDSLFRFCFTHVCNELGVEDPGELAHGKGWARLNNEFSRVMTIVRHWPYSLVIISHSKISTVKKSHKEVTKVSPNVGAAGLRWCNSAADFILYAHPEEYAERDDKGEITGEISEKRILLCHPRSWALAGGRMCDKLPAIIPLNYDEFVGHFPDTQS